MTGRSDKGTPVAGQPSAEKGWRLSPCLAPPIEERFEQDRDPMRKREALITTVIGIVLYDLFLYSDYLIDPALLWRSITVRLLIFTPVALVCFGLMATLRSRAVRETCKLTIIAVTGAGALSIVTAHSGPSAVIGQAGLILITFFGALVFRMGFSYAVATNAVLFAEDVVFMRHDRLLSRGEATTCLFLVGGCGLVSLVASHRLERSERNSFLLLMRAEAQTEKLERLNAVLAESSNRDGLTGLANRRRFDEYSQKASQEAWSAGHSVSIVMADIDHFKRLNDTFGHLAGDRVLAQVAAALQSCVRGETDMAARFGGEEFVIILPEADVADALDVAGRIVGMVREKQLQVPGCALPVSVTISCGVASCKPSENSTVTELIARADHALYDAKRSGRDRVCSTEAALHAC